MYGFCNYNVTLLMPNVVMKATAVAKQIVVAKQRAVHRPMRLTRNSIFSQIITKHNRSTLIRWDSCVKPNGKL